MFPLFYKAPEMLRRDIRYALGRCKTGNPEPYHLEVLASYQPMLDDFKLTIKQFMVDWDIHPTNHNEMIFGPMVRKSLEEFLPNGPEVEMSYILELGDIPFAAPVKTATDEILLDLPDPQVVAAETRATKKKKKAE